MRPYKRSGKNRKKEYIVMGVVIVVKLILMGLFSSDYQDKMFMPFVSAFLQGFNPYSYYFEHELLPSFPYFPLMLLIKSIDGGLWLSFNQKVFSCGICSLRCRSLFLTCLGIGSCAKCM